MLKKSTLDRVNVIFTENSLYFNLSGLGDLMDFNLHQFHIPVMGTGHSVDTPIRVASFGISSVISVVDDLLLEKIRKYYCEKYDFSYSRIGKTDEDYRARRTTAYLELVAKVVDVKLAAVKALPFFQDNDKKKYFTMLPDNSPLKVEFNALIESGSDTTKEAELTAKMEAGSIDANIMVKLDRLQYSKDGEPLDESFSDARAALRGYAKSSLSSSMIFSAGINQPLFSDIVNYPDFYRNEAGVIKKKIVLKVSDFRSALIQGKFLARKGLEVSEFRIESGLNCGGHAFASNGQLLPTLLKEISENRHKLHESVLPQVERYYKKQGWDLPAQINCMRTEQPKITVQGGIGTAGEQARLIDQYQLDRSGWASPFLLVPEATAIDETTRQLVANAGEEDLYLSPASPLGVPFNNVYGSGSAIWTQEQSKTDRPGSGCPKGHLVSNTEFSKIPICTASTVYQKQKLAQIAESDKTEEVKAALTAKVHLKQCICDHLANGALIELGIQKESRSPQSICPGPNVAWFKRYYSLEEMVNHIYGRIDSLVPNERPHMYAKEVSMYVDYFEQQITACEFTKNEVDTLDAFVVNFNEGVEYCFEIARDSKSYGDENLDSILSVGQVQRTRFNGLVAQFEKAKADAADAADAGFEA